MNWILVVIAAFLFVPKIPSIYEMYKSQGTQVQAVSVKTLDNESIKIPSGKKNVIVFWATWCGPCQIELMRINNLIKSKKITAESVIAVSIGEAFETVKKHVLEQDYKFLVGLDANREIADKYKVLATPTTFLLRENGKIDWKTAGLSPTLELRIMNFLND
jgi:cytochrome c biogenesis protein CcmG/thiol:disulfide interchange protein DsbE